MSVLKFPLESKDYKRGYEHHANDIKTVNGIFTLMKYVLLAIPATACIFIAPHAAAVMFMAWIFWKVVTK